MIRVWLEGVDGGHEQAQADPDEIDVGHREGDLAVDRNAALEQAVEQFQQRDVALAPGSRPRSRALLDEDRALAHPAAPIELVTKLYGGHGPVTCSSQPRGPYCRARVAAQAWNASVAASSTRYTPLSTICPPWPLAS